MQDILIDIFFFLLRSGASEVDLSTYFLACIAPFFFFSGSHLKSANFC